MENRIYFQATNRAYHTNGIAFGLSSNFADFDDVPAEIAKICSPDQWKCCAVVARTV